jgi:hypothetical protein
MGQATVDLPDPQRAPPQSVGADDLLAQMAGDEIDRLLAEADSGNSPAAQPAGPVDYAEHSEPQPGSGKFPDVQEPGVALDSDCSSLDIANDAPVNETQSASRNTPRVDEEPPAAAPVDPLASELNSLLDSLSTAALPLPQPTPVSAIEVVEAEEAAAIPAAETPVAVSIESAEVLAATAAEVAATGELSTGGADETSSAERSALAADSVPAEAATAQIEEPKERRSFLFLLRPLEWLNAPINVFPDTLREFVGKAAILTVVNALALILYVHFVRRH